MDDRVTAYDRSRSSGGGEGARVATRWMAVWPTRQQSRSNGLRLERRGGQGDGGGGDGCSDDDGSRSQDEKDGGKSLGDEERRAQMGG